MAIIKTFSTPQGVPANYHKLIKAEFNINNMMLELVVAIYVSKEARDAFASPLWHEYINIPFSDLVDDPRTGLYSLLTNYNVSYLRNGAPDTIPKTPEPLFLTGKAIADVVVVPVVNNIPTPQEPLLPEESVPSPPLSPTT